MCLFKNSITGEAFTFNGAIIKKRAYFCNRRLSYGYLLDR